MAINYSCADLALCVGTQAQFPRDPRPEIALSGRSNVGKSSLINTLLGRKSLARVSSAPGKTVTVNYYDVDGKLYLVDLPGYGYAKRAKEKKGAFGRLTDDFFTKNPSADALRLVIQLVDVRTGPTEDDRACRGNLRPFGRGLQRHGHRPDPLLFRQRCRKKRSARSHRTRGNLIHRNSKQRR